MSLTERALLIAAFIAIPTIAVPQHPATPAGILLSALTAMGATRVQSISLSGSAEYIAGATDETGSFSANCSVDGASQLQLQLGSGSRTETRSTLNGTPGGSWTDAEGVGHPMAGQNTMTPAAWFCPSVALASLLGNTSLNIQYVGTETKAGQSTEHFSISARSLDDTPVQQWMARLTRTDVFLDFSTFRPVAIDFNLHPDNNAMADIPAEIRFEGYTNSSGVWLPSTIEKYVNSTLMLKLTVNSSTPSAQMIAGN